MKKPQLFKVNIYLQIQMHHQRIRARCWPWGKAARTRSLLTSLLLLSRTRKPIQLNTLSAWVLVAGTQKNFLASLYSLGNCGFNHSKGFPPSARAGSFLCLQANNYKLLILVSSSNDLLSSSSIQYSHQTRWGPGVSPSVWRAAPVLRRWMAPS